jgi:hypothetical protein
MHFSTRDSRVLDCLAPSTLGVMLLFVIVCYFAVLFTFKFQHFRSHPLLNNFSLCVRLKK